MPQVRSADVISTPPCTRPRRLWCLSCASSAYSCSPSTRRCHSGPISCRKPEVSTMLQPEAFSFSAALLGILLSLPSSLRTPAQVLHPSRRRFAPPQDEVLDPHGEERGNAARLEPRGHDDSAFWSFHQTPACCSQAG